MDDERHPDGLLRVEQLRPRTDRRGWSLRKAYSRPANGSLYLKPLQALTIAIASMGLLPTGLLLSRLWMAASYQRFCAGELARWLGLIDPEADSGNVSPIRRIRPTGCLLVGWAMWAVAAGCGLAAGGMAIAGTGPAKTMLMLAGAASAAASCCQLMAIASLRLRVHQFIHRREVLDRLRPVSPVDPALPGWSVWPLALIAASEIILVGLGFRPAAVWMVAAGASVLAAEVQRGYITVADRRLRFAVARAIARKLLIAIPEQSSGDA